MHHFIEERYDHALAWVEKALHENPNFPIAFRLLAAVQGLKGNRVEARTAHERLVQLMPNVTIASTLEAVPFAYQEDAERYAEGLRRAGMVQD